MDILKGSQLLTPNEKAELAECLILMNTKKMREKFGIDKKKLYVLLRDPDVRKQLRDARKRIITKCLDKLVRAWAKSIDVRTEIMMTKEPIRTRDRLEACSSISEDFHKTYTSVDIKEEVEDVLDRLAQESGELS